MNVIINLLWLFIVQQTIAGFFVYQWGFEHSAFTLLFEHRRYAIPLLIISFGVPLYIILVWLYKLYSEPQESGLREFPLLGVTKVENRFLPFFRKLSYFCFIVFPWVGFIWMWVAFHDSRQDVWLQGDLSVMVHKYSIEGPITDFIGNWDKFRYGRDGSGDSSYVPFWQPIVIMWLSTIMAAAMAIRVTIDCYKSIFKQNIGDSDYGYKEVEKDI